MNSVFEEFILKRFWSIHVLIYLEQLEILERASLSLALDEGLKEIFKAWSSA